ncbi:gp53-like domain-containing protein [Azospirillum argentinense]|uniref:Putative tail fiber protein gp53-like C-terminal domain-containing protein n=1 Tax=Azospirillum brasilense TaxID=192 RepID=A0A4D8PWX6_AZOBR|nr:hypothetical protein [Azospirillum argentinense]QCO03024.1 hypothetical protein D3867_13985 [Azospirillum argentinense]
MSLGSRVRQSIQGAGPTSFALVDDASATQSRTIVTAYGSGSTRIGIFTIIDQAAAQWAVVEGYATAGSSDTFTVTRTIRNSQGNANNLTWSTTNAKTIFVGECADLIAQLCQCPLSTGTGTAYAVTLTPTPLALVQSSVLRFFAHTINTGAATLAINGLPAWPIRRADNSAVAAGQLHGVVEVLADPANSRFILINASTLQPSDWDASLASVGRRRDPTGYLVQWATILTAGGAYSWSYPIPYPSQCFGVTATAVGSAAATGTGTPSTVSCAIYSGSASQYVYVEAKGV